MFKNAMKYTLVGACSLFAFVATPSLSAAADFEVPLRLVDGAASGYGSALVLVRPDHYVAWVGDEAGVATARAVLGQATGQR